MKYRYPLFLKVLLWLFLNILIIAAALSFLLNTKYQTEIESLLGGKAGKRLKEISYVVRRELNSKPQSEWNEIIKNFSQIYGIQLFLFRCNGYKLAGENITFPEEVLIKLGSIRGVGAMRGRGPPQGYGHFRSLNIDQDEPKYFFIRSSADSSFWAGIRIYLDQDNPVGGGTALVAKIDSLFNNTIFDFNMLLFAVCAAILISILFWLPFIGNLTRSIKKITNATEKIANGEFQNRIKENRRDELGVLAASINRLAEQLDKYVSGQKRFLGDTAHELCSPLARIEMAVGIIEQHADGRLTNYLNDIREDLNQMSNLIKELLYFSKVGLQESKIELKKVNLKSIIQNIANTEKANNLKINISDNFTIIANPELIERAIANLIRNSIRYAGNDGEIEVSAIYKPSMAIITVADHGPGVPEPELEKIFKPFYRIETSRNRDFGGAGLGLAITKACVEAHRGTVRAMNRAPRGLIVEIQLPMPEA